MALTVLQIIPALGTGGAEQACVDVAAALSARGDVSLVVSSGGRRVQDIEKGGSKHLLCEAASKNPVLILRNAIWLANLIRHHKVDIVHARSRAPAWSAWLACRATDCHYVTTFHAAYKFSSLPKKFYNRVMALGERVIAISPYIQRHIQTHYGLSLDKIPLVNRGVRLDEFDPANISDERKEKLIKAWGIKADDALVLLPGRLSPIKNHGLVIDAFWQMKKQKKKMPLVCFVGDDQGRLAYSDSLSAHIKQTGLSKHIKMVGSCSDMAAALSLSSLVLMPSKVPEGFGRVPVEAMAMGVPVIASNLGATQDTIIDGKTGWLLPPEDPASWAAAIERALAMSAGDLEKMAKAARAHVARHFSNQVMVAKTLAVYDDVMKEGREA